MFTKNEGGNQQAVSLFHIVCFVLLWSALIAECFSYLFFFLDIFTMAVGWPLKTVH